MGRIEVVDKNILSCQFDTQNIFVRQIEVIDTIWFCLFVLLGNERNEASFCLGPLVIRMFYVFIFIETFVDVVSKIFPCQGHNILGFLGCDLSLA